MKLVNRRSFRDINGLINLAIHYIGLRNTCRIKEFISEYKSREKKAVRLSQLTAWVANENTDNQKFSYNKYDWEHSFKQLLRVSNDDFIWDTVSAFYNCRPTLIKDIDNDDDDVSPTVVCVERNEYTRIKEFLKHYRKLGIKRFLICDNNSSDGTREFLMGQEDVRLYRTDEIFSSQKQSAWQLRMIADNGINKWYLYLDADEFAAYSEMDNVNLNQLVERLSGRNIFAVKAIMIEMYPKGRYASNDFESERFLEEHRYFDGDGDGYEYDEDRNEVFGGFISRVFHESHFSLVKLPLYFHTKDRFLIGSHHIYPFYEDTSADYGLILKHYKFLPNDLEMIKDAIAGEYHVNGSRMYKKYIHLYEDNVGAYCKQSKEWNEDYVHEFDIIKNLYKEER